MADEESVPSREGEVLAGKYLLQQMLGVGGMGSVYRAENQLIGRAVAIKVLHPEYARRPDIVRRFLQEGRAANLVRHPNVVDVLDVGQDAQGVPFIVQELLSGEDFGKVLTDAGGKLTVDRALEVLLPIIDAVGMAHAKGVVHRDLKPENIFLHRDGDRVTPKLLDFGISQLALSPGQARLTSPGTAMGTPAYMSPEQVVAKPSIDARSDVWSLGVILYETLTGTTPFVAETAGEYMVKIATTKPRAVSAVAPDLGAPIAYIIETCLRGKVEERYDDARGLAADLRRALKATAPLPGPSAAPPPPPRIPTPPPAAMDLTDLQRAPPVMDVLPALDLDPEELRATTGQGPAAPEPPPPFDMDSKEMAAVRGAPRKLAPPPKPKPADLGPSGELAAFHAGNKIELAVPMTPSISASARARPPQPRPGPAFSEMLADWFKETGKSVLNSILVTLILVVALHAAEIYGFVTLPFHSEALTQMLTTLGLRRPLAPSHGLDSDGEGAPPARVTPPSVPRPH